MLALSPGCSGREACAVTAVATRCLPLMTTRASTRRWLRWQPDFALDGLLAAKHRASSRVVKNITVSLDEETYRRARMKAAEQDTSVSALVRRFLTDLVAGESENERLKRQEHVLRERITFRAGDRLSRDAVHRRGG